MVGEREKPGESASDRVKEQSASNVDLRWDHKLDVAMNAPKSALSPTGSLLLILAAVGGLMGMSVGFLQGGAVPQWGLLGAALPAAIWLALLPVRMRRKEEQRRAAQAEKDADLARQLQEAKASGAFDKWETP